MRESRKVRRREMRSYSSLSRSSGTAPHDGRAGDFVVRRGACRARRRGCLDPSYLGVEVIELAGEHVPERGDDVLGYLHSPVVVLDLLLDVDHAHRLPGAARPLRVPTRTDEVRVDDPGPVLGVGHHQP